MGKEHFVRKKKLMLGISYYVEESYVKEIFMGYVGKKLSAGNIEENVNHKINLRKRAQIFSSIIKTVSIPFDLIYTNNFQRLNIKYIYFSTNGKIRRCKIYFASIQLQFNLFKFNKQEPEQM